MSHESSKNIDICSQSDFIQDDKNAENRNYLLQLPNEIVQLIMVFIGWKDCIKNVSLVCKHLQREVQAEILWKTFCTEEFRIVSNFHQPPQIVHSRTALLASNLTSWRETFKQMLKQRKSNVNLNPGAIKRIQRELLQIQRNPSENFIVAPTEDIAHWIATVRGPESSPYAGGLFLLDIWISESYPFKPPKIFFSTKIFHCNISQTGDICLHLLCCQWSPAFTIEKCLSAIVELLSNPDSEEAYPDPGSLYKKDRSEYDKQAREWTKKYAN